MAVFVLIVCLILLGLRILISGATLRDCVCLIRSINVFRLSVVMTSKTMLVLKVCVLYSRQSDMTKLPCRIGTLIVY